MLTQRVIFTVLGVALYLCSVAFGDDIDYRLQFNDGDHDIIFPMSHPTGVQECIVTTNTGVEFSLVPPKGVPPGISREFVAEKDGTCEMVIAEARFEHRGLWEIRAIKSGVPTVEPSVTVKRFLLYFNGTDIEEVEYEKIGYRQQVSGFPSRRINIFPGNTVALRLLHRYENLTRCIAISPDGQRFDVTNAGNDWVNHIRSFDQCGVLVRVNYTHAGEWRLEATIGEDTIYYGEFEVEVEDPIAIDSEPRVTYVQDGDSVSIGIGPNNAVSCQLKNPNGQNLTVRSGICEIEIPTVSKLHEGTWTASYGLQGRMDVVKERVNLVTYDNPAFNATVTVTDNGEVNLLCSVREYAFYFCRFVSPNGEVLNVFEGIGNDRYRYYGNGSKNPSMMNHRTHECGITISKPDYSDYGSWKCILGTSSGLSGSILRVTGPEVDSVDPIRASFQDDVYVVKGNSFTVKCSVNAALKYCWLGSPNGTAYSVSSISKSPTTLPYTGMGLSFGECGAVISAAEDTDEGKWHCGMGVYNGAEIESIVRVMVTDTLLIPDMRNVTVRRNRAELSCSLIPGHEASIDYCRWIQPSGFGIERWTSSAFYNGEFFNAYSTDKTCHLDIENVREAWHIGKWTCVAGLLGSSLEVSATIHVSEKETPAPNSSSSSSSLASWSFGLGLGFISIIVGCILLLVVRSKLRSNLRSTQKMGQPPSYEAHHTGIPPVTTSRPQL